VRSLVGKRVLITGAGGGLGRQMSLAFSAAGAEIVVTDVDATAIAETARLVLAAGGRAICVTMDVTDTKSVLAARQQLHQMHGAIDILVNNAGIVRGGQFLDVSVEAHCKTLDVNAMGPVIVTHAFLPDLIAQPESHCVNIVSAAGLIPVPNCATYAASKWAALGLSNSIREELRRAGHRHVRVMAVCPGFLNTEMFGEQNVRFMPRLQASDLAGHIVHAVRANKPYLLSPWLVKTIPLCRAMLPLLIRQWVFDWLGVSTLHPMADQPSLPATGVAQACPPSLDPLFPGGAADPQQSTIVDPPSTAR
jgi:all-trans-retinol dehydrogenase (NAD+)